MDYREPWSTAFIGTRWNGILNAYIRIDPLNASSSRGSRPQGYVWVASINGYRRNLAQITTWQPMIRCKNFGEFTFSRAIASHTSTSKPCTSTHGLGSVRSALSNKCWRCTSRTQAATWKKRTAFCTTGAPSTQATRTPTSRRPPPSVMLSAMASWLSARRRPSRAKEGRRRRRRQQEEEAEGCHEQEEAEGHRELLLRRRRRLRRLLRPLLGLRRRRRSSSSRESVRQKRRRR